MHYCERFHIPTKAKEEHLFVPCHSQSFLTHFKIPHLSPLVCMMRIPEPPFTDQLLHGPCSTSCYFTHKYNIFPDPCLFSLRIWCFKEMLFSHFIAIVCWWVNVNWKCTILKEKNYFNELMICLLSKIDNEKIISPIVRSGEWCDQKGDRVSKYDTSWLIDSMR